MLLCNPCPHVLVACGMIKMYFARYVLGFFVKENMVQTWTGRSVDSVLLATSKRTMCKIGYVSLIWTC